MAKNRKTLLISLSCALALVIALCGFGAYAGDTNIDGSANENTSADLIDQYQYVGVPGVNGTINSLSAVQSDDSRPSEVLEISHTAIYRASDVLLPSVNSFSGETTEVNGTFNNETISANLWNSDVNNAVDRIVFVHNKSNSPVYVRTVFAFEYAEMEDKSFKDIIALNINSSDWNWSWTEESQNDPDPVVAEINDKKYWLICATYKCNSNNLLGAGDVSQPSLYQFAFREGVTSEDAKLFGDTYELMVASEAVQYREGISADAVFAGITAEIHPWANNSVKSENTSEN